ncbi:MAG: CocE/NonD family hydrolase [Pseudomonadota bacterium]|nr:CocE/NonD family hydrolase [Pseudomonadota bacterium]
MRVLEHIFIPLADGARLAARAWFPDNPRAPAILEYIPYRKRDGTRSRDEPMHGYFAQAGYVAVRVDLRGSGESDGLLADEYLARELDDAAQVIDWLSRQPWCDGHVGMMGKSWGGFNALQVAALRPPALKAILTVCSTDDRYADDVHFMGGALLNDNLWWGAIMLAYQARPPDPELRADWRDVWLQRLQAMPFWPALWLQHQRRDAYWRHGSICEDFASVQCPVFAVGGWADAYSNAVPRLLAGLSVPRLGLIGPWAHLYPHDGKPGPSIGFLQEAVRWWDHWLKGENNAVMAAPMLRAFIEQGPENREMAAGRFVGEPQWPSPNIERRALEVSAAGLGLPAPATTVDICSPPWTGAACGEWMGTGAPHEAAWDQRLDDGYSRCFDSAPLAAPYEILGAPELEIEITSDKPVAQICARLCDVSPDGASRRISYAVLNLTHRDSHAEPSALTPGVFYRVKIKLNDCGCAFAAGHRLRLAVSSAYWPLIWPAPERATLTLRLPARLTLPVRPARDDAPAIAFAPREAAADAPKTSLRRGRVERRVSFDLGANISRYETIAEGGLFGEGAYRFDDIDTEIAHDLTRRFTIGDDPLSARYELTQSYEMGRENWRIRIETRVAMRATATDFVLEARLDAFENGALAHSRDYAETIARDLI